MAHTSKVAAEKSVSGPSGKNRTAASASLRRTRIALLKEMIENDEYVDEAIRKLAGSLTTGLMK
jgi:hypothetical protein